MARVKKFDSGGVASISDLFQGGQSGGGGGGGAAGGLNQINNGAQTVASAIGQASSAIGQAGNALGGGGSGGNLGSTGYGMGLQGLQSQLASPVSAPDVPVALSPYKKGGRVEHVHVTKHKQGGSIKSVSRNKTAPKW